MVESIETPAQRVPPYCSPQRPDETDDDHFVRWKAHRDAWRQQFIDDYYKQKEARLPSPHSEDDLDEVAALEEVRYIERLIRLESGHPEPRDLPNRVERPRVVCPPGKSLSEISEHERSPFSPIPRRRPEDDEYDPVSIFHSPSPVLRPEDEGFERVGKWMLGINSPTPTRKRGSSPAEASASESPAKRRKTDTGSELTPGAPSTSNHKRKRVQFADLDEPQAASAQVHSSPKRRKTDAHSRPTPVNTSSSRKRGREPEADESPVHEAQGSSRPGLGVPSTKKRRVDEDSTTSDLSGRRDRESTVRTGRGKNAVMPPSRITRARHRQLSGTDAQLFQLGHRGQLDMQSQPHETQRHDHKIIGRAAEAAANRPRPRRSATKTGLKASNNTNTATKDRATTTTSTKTNTRTNTHPKRKARAGNKAQTTAGAGTKTRRGRSNQ